jgi:hypothetical protein
VVGIPIEQTLQRLRQEDCEFQVSWAITARPCFKRAKDFFFYLNVKQLFGLFTSKLRISESKGLTHFVEKKVDI